jgi:sulfur relay (sulfurtransferase) complex TusBCD TusD component (DsrE family)
MSTLGILVNSDKYGDEITGIVRAAKAAGHEVKIFMMDDGVLLADELCGAVAGEAEIAYCDHSAEPRGVKDVEGATSGSQYQNAVMMHDSDKVVVF